MKTSPREMRSAAKLTTRRRRTAARFACESLEGRKLMTAMGGDAAATAGNGPADLGGMAGGPVSPVEIHHDHRADDATPGQDGGAPMILSLKAPTRDASGMADGMMSATGERPMFKGEQPDDGTGPGAQADASTLGWRNGRGPGGPGEVPMNQRGNAPASTGNGNGGQQGPGQGTPNPQLVADLQKLRTDAQAIRDKSQVTPALLAAVRKDLTAIANAKTGTAAADALRTLATDRQAIFAGLAAPTDAQRAQLQADLDAVLKSQGVPQALIDQLAADRLAVKVASNFTSGDKATLDADRKAIDADRAATGQPGATDPATTATATTTAASATTAATTTTPANATPAATSAAATTTSAAPTGGEIDPNLMSQSGLPVGGARPDGGAGRATEQVRRGRPGGKLGGRAGLSDVQGRMLGRNAGPARRGWGR